MKKRGFCKAVFFAAALLLAGCGFRTTPAPPPRGSDPALDLIAAYSQDATPAPTEKGWLDNMDVDKFFDNPWFIAAFFLAIQWFEIWYFNRTGKKSTTIDAAEAAMQPKLGIVQRVLYWLWRRVYFWKNRDKKDPDKEEGEK